MEKTNAEKSKEGISNLIMFIGAILIVIAISLFVMDSELFIEKSFFMSLSGTVLVLLGNSLKKGYFSLFN